MEMLDDLVCLSHLRWGFVYQRPNHLMSRWARERRVFFVEEPHLDADTPTLEVMEIAPRLHVVVPHLVPRTGRREGERVQRELLDRLTERAGVRHPIVWFYTPMAL